jgi:hypothetical protein
VSLVRRFTERVAAALLSLVATGMALGGLALAGLGATLRQTDIDMDGMPVITAGLMAAGAILALAGGISVIWSRGAGFSDQRLALLPGSGLLVLPAAAALPVLLATQLDGLIVYWLDVARLADQYNVWASANGPTALVFVPAAGVLLVPALEAMTALVLALACALQIVLILVRSAAIVKLSAVGALLVGGLTGASWMGTVATERIAPAVEALIRTTAAAGLEQTQALALLARHRAVGSDSVWTLSLGCAGLVLLAIGVRRVTGTRVETDPISDFDAVARRL